MKKEKPVFKVKEKLAVVAWSDPKWKEVNRLRNEGRNLQAKNLITEIMKSWGI